MALLGIPDLPPRAFIRKAGGGIIPQGGGSSPTQTETKTTGLPSWALPYAKDTLAKQQALSDRPYEAYGAERIAGFSPLQEQAKNTAAGMETSGATGAGIGLAGMAGLGGLNTQNFGSQQAQQYMSPYIQNVVDIGKREAQRQSGIQGAQQQSQAAQAGAFGGSRDAIMRAERERNLGTQMGDIQAQGNQMAYTNAQQQFNADQNRGLQGLQVAGQAANTLGQLGGQQFQQGMDINKLQGAYGAQEQGMKQQGLDLAYQDFQNQRNYPQQQLGYMANMINGLPLGSTSTGTTTGTPGSPSGLQTLGALGMGAYGLSQMPSFGLSKFFADGGSVDSEDNIASIVKTLSNEQLDQAAKAAQARGDVEQLKVVNNERAERASMVRGLGSMPVDMSKMMPTEESMARGGIVAFNGDEEDGSLVGAGVYSPGDPVAFKNSMSKANQLLAQLYGLKPTPSRTTKQRDDDVTRYYEKMKEMSGPDIYADYENELKADKASYEDDLKQNRAMAAFAAIPEILKGNDFTTAAGNAFGAFSKSYGEGTKAARANKRANTKGLFDIADSKRREKLAYLKDAQANSDALDRAIKEGNTAEADRLFKLIQLETGIAKANKVTKSGGGAPKPFDVINKAELAYAQNPTTANRIVVEAARRSAAALKEMGPGALAVREDTAELARSTKVNEAVANAKDKLKYDKNFLKLAKIPGAQDKAMEDKEAEVRRNFARNQRSGSEPAQATGGPTVSNWN